MIDLHLHLDGSLTAAEIITLAKRAGVCLPSYDETAFAPYLCFDGKTKSLDSYLKCFDLPLGVLQTADNITLAVSMLAERLYGLGCKYAEVRFAPCLHTRCGLSVDKVVSAAIKGLDGAALPIKLLLCCMRGAAEEDNKRTLAAALDRFGSGVCGLDIAGAEAHYPTELYKNIFKTAFREGLPFTMHAGEAAGADSVRCALDCGAWRIGHCVAAMDDIPLQEELKRAGVCIEACPTSNVQTGAVFQIAAHPIKQFLDNGLKVCVNSDNMTVSSCDVFSELRLVTATFGLCREEVALLIKNAADAAFISQSEKQKMFSDEIILAAADKIAGQA